MEDSSRSFVLYPEAELNQNMGILAHPDRKIRSHEDIYVHVSSIPDPESNQEEVQNFTLKLAKGDSAKTESAVVVFENLVQVKDVPELAQYDFVAKARLSIFKKGKSFTAEPMFIIEDRQPLSLPVFIQEAGMGFTFAGVMAEEGKIVIEVEEIRETEDWVVLKAISKPWINLLWLGTFILVLGFGIAIWRRVSFSGRTE
jgi:cytochrome c-type biogenesis protein CcmF